MIRSPSVRVGVKKSFLLDITAASVNGSSVDTFGYTRAMAVFESNPSGAGTTSNCKVQASADNSAWNDLTTANYPAIAANAAFSQVTPGGGAGPLTGDQVQEMDIDLVQVGVRYLRLVHTGVGASAAGQAVGQVYLFNAATEPVSQDNTPIDTITISG